MIVYIAGPMTGLPEFNFPEFFRAQAYLEVRGFDVLNPARRPAVDGESWASCLRKALRDVLDADAVALLPGWETSRGAVLEVNVAASLGMPCQPLNLFHDPAV